jgi:hypothetical protein
MKVILRIIWMVAGAAVLAASQSRAEFDLIGVQWSFTNSLVVALSSETGQGVVVGLAGVSRLNSLAGNSSGQLFSVGGDTGNQLVMINPSTGVATNIATVTFGTEVPSVRGLAFSSNDILYAINSVDFPSPKNNLYTINLQTGSATLVGNAGLSEFSGIQGLDFSPQGALYGWVVAGLGLVIINPTTGLASDVNPLVDDDGALSIQTLAFGPDGNLYGTGENDGFLYQIDVATGAGTFVGATGYPSLRGIARMPPPVLSIRLSEVQEVEVCWPSISNQLYRVEYRSDLTTNMWTFLKDVQASNRTTCVIDKIGVGHSQRFYRLVPPQ